MNGTSHGGTMPNLETKQVKLTCRTCDGRRYIDIDFQGTVRDNVPCPDCNPERR